MGLLVTKCHGLTQETATFQITEILVHAHIHILTTEHWNHQTKCNWHPTRQLWLLLKQCYIICHISQAQHHHSHNYSQEDWKQGLQQLQHEQDCEKGHAISFFATVSVATLLCYLLKNGLPLSIFQIWCQWTCLLQQSRPFVSTRAESVTSNYWRLSLVTSLLSPLLVAATVWLQWQSGDFHLQNASF